MEWNNEKTIEFIDSYRNFTCLWRCEDPNYKNRIIRNDAVQELCTKYSITPKQVLNKIKSLRSYFHKEHTKVSKKKSGSATSETYKSSWFAYTSMLFILDGDTQRSGTETELAEYDSQEHTSENEGNSTIEVNCFLKPKCINLSIYLLFLIWHSEIQSTLNVYYIHSWFFYEIRIF